MSNDIELSAAEQRAYDLIVSEDGVLQSELWKALDADSRKGSRLAQSLAEKEIIKREPTTHNGQRTFFLNPIDEPPIDGTASISQQTGAPPEEPSDEVLSEREERALALIRENGGMYQSEFWKALDVGSRTGSRIATNIEDKEKIRRVETTHNRRRTFYLSPMPRDLDFSLLMAGEKISPFVGTDEGLDPLTSAEFTEWILNLTQTER